MLTIPVFVPAAMARLPRFDAAILADVSVRYLSCGDTAFTVEFGNEISPQINGQVMALHAAIGQAKAAAASPGWSRPCPPCAR